jgi:hypothetical protein
MTLNKSSLSSRWVTRASTAFAANVEFIRRFQRDYNAEVHYLVENYRSTRHIIDAANRLIGANTDRMKTDHPIRIDRHREMLPPRRRVRTTGRSQPRQSASGPCARRLSPGARRCR